MNKKSEEENEKEETPKKINKKFEEINYPIKNEAKNTNLLENNQKEKNNKDKAKQRNEIKAKYQLKKKIEQKEQKEQ